MEVHAMQLAANFTVQFGDLPTWLAGLGTVGALFAALWQIRAERNLRLKREEQERLERHREQARLISAMNGLEEPEFEDPWSGKGRTFIELINGSPEPVYQVVAAIVAVQGTIPRTIERWLEFTGRDGRKPIAVASMLPPGSHRLWVSGVKWAMGSGFNRPGAEVAFTDRNGNHWIRRATGQLDELPEDAFTHYQKLGLHGPLDLQTPERSA